MESWTRLRDGPRPRVRGQDRPGQGGHVPEGGSVPGGSHEERPGDSGCGVARWILCRESYKAFFFFL